jgi:hypothetical protein
MCYEAGWGLFPDLVPGQAREGSPADAAQLASLMNLNVPGFKNIQRSCRLVVHLSERQRVEARAAVAACRDEIPDPVGEESSHHRYLTYLATLKIDLVNLRFR